MHDEAAQCHSYVSIVANYWVFATLQSQGPILTLSSPQLDDRQYYCPAEELIFTCTIRTKSNGSGIIGWSSEEYIRPGAGGTLLHCISIKDNPGQRCRGQENLTDTFATPVDRSYEPTGTLVLVSQLHIRASSTYMNATINCTNINSGGSASHRFQVMGRSNIYSETKHAPSQNYVTGGQLIMWLIIFNRCVASVCPLLKERHCYCSRS